MSKQEKFKTKSVKRQKSEGTQEFFNKNRSGETFTFNKAPVNKNEIIAKLKEDASEKKTARKRSAFVSKLYDSDEDIPNLKVLAGDDFDSDVEEGMKPKKRDKKQKDKTVVDQIAKVSAVKFVKGSVGLFAISQIDHQNKFAIVNHTRNIKGFISFLEHPNLMNVQPGQFVVATVESIGTNKFSETSRPNGKLQLSLDPNAYNRSLTADKVNTGMLLQGTIEGKEQKGFVINLGFKDNAKAFLKFDDNVRDTSFATGNLVQVVVKTVTSKMVKCELLTKVNAAQSVKTDISAVTLHTLKPGFFVSAKVSKIFENGIEVSFLGGLSGTVFADHLGKSSIAKFKIGEKVQARVISVDIAQKNVTLSLQSHLLNMTPSLVPVHVGQVFENVKVERNAYGSSFIVKLTESTEAFLHKSHIPTELVEQGDEDAGLKPEEQKAMRQMDKIKGRKKKTVIPGEVSVGSILPKVVVKEVNLFDNMAMISLRPDLLAASAIDYSALKPGQFVQAKIEHVDEIAKLVTLSLNNFVKGLLSIEHISDNPLKVLPPKYTKPGKTIRVRVFSVKPNGRKVTDLVFTKKDSLMKEDIEVFETPDDVKKGDKILGVVVGKTEHGYVVKSFNFVKGLLTFAEAKDSVKVGSLVKAYVLFNKKSKGLALTTHKKKVAKEETQSESVITFLPTSEQASALKKQFKNLLANVSSKAVGKVFACKLVEQKDAFYLVQSDGKKKVFALIPKILATSFGQSIPLTGLFKVLVLEVYEGIPIATVKPELIELKENIPKAAEEIQSGKTFVGFVSAFSDKLGATVRFSNGLSKLISIKDLDNVGHSKYTVGQTVRVGFNTVDRLSLKQKVLAATDGQVLKSDQEVAIKALGAIQSSAMEALCVQAGQKVKTTVQLLKDYGLITQLQNDLTGFIVNHQRQSAKHKEGAELTCIVLDADVDKRFVDLSERLASEKNTSKSLSGKQKAIVELSKENYIISSLKQDRSVICLTVMHHFNEGTKSELYKKFVVGDEMEVRIVPDSDPEQNGGFVLSTPVGGIQTAGGAFVDNLDSLSEGKRVRGSLKSVKGNCLYIQIGMNGKLPIIGRLAQIECTNSNEFSTFKPGDKIEAKVLKMHTEHGRVMIELSRRQQHMDVADDGLNADYTFENVKEGFEVTGIVSDVPVSVKVTSCPVTVSVSSLVRAHLLFSDVLATSDLTTFKSADDLIKKKYPLGKEVKLIYTQGKFCLKKQQSEFQKGDLVVVRFVKATGSFGVTVQLNEKTYGAIELCELTDDVVGNVSGMAKEKSVFLARVIDTDKKGRLQLSSRASVVDPTMWALISPDGSSGLFKNQDFKRQTNGNLRNKILKYGSKLAIQRGDLVLGYVTGISKAGCFVQVGHGTTVRVGLNELHDSTNYDFRSQVPIGRIVVCRITQTLDDNTRFNGSFRRSLVVYGVHQVNKNDLKPDLVTTAFVLALADGAAFAQLKGSYLKLKIKNPPKQLQVGDFCEVVLTKVQSDEIKADFKSMKVLKNETGEQQAIGIYDSVQEESLKDIEAAKNVGTSDEPDLNTEIVDRAQANKLEQQIKDLETLQEVEEAADDSDADDMRRIIQENDVSDDSDQEMDSDADSAESDEDEEEGEDEDEEMNSGTDSESEEPGKKKKLTGQKALKKQIADEKVIRQKEKEMRDKDGVQPKSVNDFERMLVADKDQSYLWIQYMAFMLEKLDADAARKVAERAVKSVSMTAEADKLNIWIAYMNLENSFGKKEQLQDVVRRALEVNDRKKVYLQLITIYRASKQYDFIEDIFKKLCKKYFDSLEIWAAYMDYLFEATEAEVECTAPKVILQKALQALPKHLHINVISKFGALEFKQGNVESGRTMFEGIVTNYPKRMDIWSIYMDLEAKHATKENSQQARNLFERCLSQSEITKKPKKMKLVFRKYMEFELGLGNASKVDTLRKRVEEYLEKTFKKESSSSNSDVEMAGAAEQSSESEADDQSQSD